MKRKIGLTVCVASLALIFSMNASANTITTTTQTSGGTAGKVTILSEISAVLRQPTGNINIGEYNVVSEIAESQNLYTNFEIQATLSNTSSSHKISKSGFANSLLATYSMTTQSTSELYDQIASTTTTYSDAFGDSYQECNGRVLNINP